jgi:Na+/proline symporter
LEHRFDSKTRLAAAIVFLIQRGLGVGLALYAPAVVLSVILGWSERATVLIMAGIVLAYAVPGGIKAITWTDVQQMLLIFLGIIAALVTAVLLLPPDISFGDALYLAGASSKLNAVDLSFDLNNRYNIWSGLIGGGFLALSYFGCDQSQVQRYLTGKSIRHSRISLLFNAVVKVPLQFVILLTGALVFSFFLFAKPPMLFNHQQASLIEQSNSPELVAQYRAVEQRYDQALEERSTVARQMVALRHNPPSATAFLNPAQLRRANDAVEATRQDGIQLLKQVNGGKAYDDTNYIFLNFVIRYFPVGLVGLVIAAIFAAAMSTISGELNSLATSTTIDLYRRFWKPDASDHQCVRASKLATVFWGIYAGVFASFGGRLGSLIEAINMVGSLFYGSLLGVFVLAFGFRRATGTGAFIGLAVGEIAVLLTAWLTSISYLWYNVVGCVVVVVTGLLVSAVAKQPPTAASLGGRA